MVSRFRTDLHLRSLGWLTRLFLRCLLLERARRHCIDLKLLFRTCRGSYDGRLAIHSDLAGCKEAPIILPFQSISKG